MDFIESLTKELMEASDTYSVKVDLDVMQPGMEIEFGFPDQVEVKFEIDMDVRSWGIKDILVIPKGKVVIPLDVDGKDVEIEVDLETAVLEYEEADFISPTELHVTIDKDLKVIESTLYVGFFSK